jgi:phosphoserine phosphatase
MGGGPFSFAFALPCTPYTIRLPRNSAVVNVAQILFVNPVHPVQEGLLDVWLSVVVLCHMQGIESLIRALQARGIAVYLISGGFR